MTTSSTVAEPVTADRYYSVSCDAKPETISGAPAKKLKYGVGGPGVNPNRKVYALLRPLDWRRDRLCPAMHGRRGGRSD